ncbi:DUF4296 domain-containing protein, partial [Schleiferiaceae bacterium]|nr:DUF4296 domain-containing protein [Schleiferiaceae bacterium]
LWCQNSFRDLNLGRSAPYEKDGITEDQFKTSFAFYSDNPTVFIPIYEEVLDSLKANGALLAKKGVKIEYED